jgi:hypothetical protein
MNINGKSSIHNNTNMIIEPHDSTDNVINNPRNHKVCFSIGYKIRTNCVAFLILVIMTAIFSLPLTSCKATPPIGDIVFDAPVMALSFEMGEDDGVESGGVVYRKVNDVDKLIASEDLLMIAFFDGKALSNAAIPFTEILCDNFSKSLKIVRVNIGQSGDDSQVDEVKSRFEITGYPYFVIIQKGSLKYSFSGFDKSVEDNITEKLTKIV